MVAARVGLEDRCGGLQERLTGGQREEQQLEQRQAVYPLGMVERELDRDGRAARVAGHVRRANAESVEQAAASEAWSAIVTGGGVWVLPAQPRLW